MRTPKAYAKHKRRLADISHEVLWSAMRPRIAFIVLMSLQPYGMPRIKTARWAIDGLPARRPFAGVMIEWRRVESQSGDDCEGMTVACVDGDPFARAALAVAAKLG